MIDKLKALWERLRIRWHVVVLALLAASPEIITYLSGLDLKPILSHFLSASTVDLVVGLLPFLLIFLKSAVHLDAEEAKQ